MASPYERRKRKAVKAVQSLQAAKETFSQARQEYLAHQDAVRDIERKKERLEKDYEAAQYGVNNLLRAQRQAPKDRNTTESYDNQLGAARSEVAELKAQLNQLMSKYHEIMQKDNLLKSVAERALASYEKLEGTQS